MNRGIRVPFPKMSEAMDGRREAHRDVLVAVFGKGTLMPQPPNAATLGMLPYTFDSHRTTR
ncbi:hypothetical protein MARHY2347 [Marinobacter nauticus ATCC 49840]|nr:hypothetical protein MARHY2347 [Marinobacter nauticus ATCC 49840]